MKPPRKGLKKGTAKKAIVVSKVKGYGHDPFFVKKAKATQAILEKYGLPDSMSKV